MAEVVTTSDVTIGTTTGSTISYGAYTPSTVATDETEKLNETIESLKAEIEKLKKAQSSASADASEWKKKYRETLDEKEREKQEREEAFNEMQTQLATYKTNERVAKYTAKLIESGFDPEVAKSMAVSLPDGVEDAFFENQKSFFENQKLKAKQEALNSQPSLSTGMPMSGKTAEEIENENMRRWMGLPPK